MDDEFWEHLLHKGTEFIELAEFGNAVETFEQVARSGHPEAAPKAAALLGLLLSETGDTEQAATLFEYAMASAHQVAAPKAALGLAHLRYAQGDISGTQHAYAVAALSDEIGMATTAKVAIEQLYEEFEQYLATLPIGQAEFERARRLHTIDDDDGAQAAFRRSIASRDPEYAPRSATDLAIHLLDNNETDEGRELLRLAVESQHAEQAPVAALLLADHLVEHDEQQPAREMLTLASMAQDHQTALEASVKLAELLVRTEQYVSAIERFAVLMAEAETEIGAHAAFRIGVLLDEVDDRTAAACFGYASAYAPPDIAEAARQSGQRTVDRMDQSSTETSALQEVPLQEVPLQEVQDRVGYALGRLWLSDGAVDEARRAFETARESQIPGIAEDAENFLRSTVRATDAEASDAGHGTEHEAAHAARQSARPRAGHRAEDQPGRQEQPVGHSPGEGNRPSGFVDRTDAAVMQQVDPEAIRAWAVEASEEQLDQVCSSLMEGGHSCYDRNETLEAVRSWERVAATGHPSYAPAAVAQIAVVFYATEGMPSAEGGMNLLTDLGLGELQSRAWFVFARRLTSARESEASQSALRRAATGEAEHAVDCVQRLLVDDREHVRDALTTVRSRTPELVPEVLQFAVTIAEAKKRAAADAFRVADMVASIAGDENVAEAARKEYNGLSA